jgi:hypothetical protein
MDDARRKAVLDGAARELGELDAGRSL